MGFKYQTPQNSISCEKNEDAFADDVGLAFDGCLGDIKNTLRHNSQVDRRYLYTTGGKLSLKKCFWTLADWSWQEGNAPIVPYGFRTVRDHRLQLHNSEDYT